MKCIEIFLLLLIINVSLFSEELQFELINQITDERLEWDLEEQGSGESNGPSGIVFNENGELYIASAKKALLLKYSNENGLETVLSPEQRNAVTFASNLYTENHQYWGVDINGTAYGWYNSETDSQYFVDFMTSSMKDDVLMDSYYMSENYFFHYLDDGGIICIPNPTLNNSENLRRTIRNDEVIALFNERSIDELDGLSIDENFYLYLDGNFANYDYYHYVSYWARKHGFVSFEEYRNDQRNKEMVTPIENASYMTYIGRDRLGYVYYRVHNSFIDIYKDGWCVKSFSFNAAGLAPTVDFEGNIYKFNLNIENEYNITLYRALNWPE